jgi:hypothetical protein
MKAKRKCDCDYFRWSQGSDYTLTETRSKPAVPIGGKYRLVDIQFQIA